MDNQHVRISIVLDDGSVALMSFLTQGRGNILPYGAEWSETEGWWKREPTDANIFHEISRAFAGDRPQPVSYRIVSPDEIPADRTYRGALSDDGKKLYHDMPKARELHRGKLRRARVAMFAENDVALMTATVDGDKDGIEKAKARRQYLRDAPADPRIEAAKTTDELKAITLA